MKKLTIIGLFLLSLTLQAQDNLQIQFAYRNYIVASKYLPSTQALPDANFELSLQYNLWVANRSISYNSIRTIYNQQRITEENINEIIAELNDENRIGVGQDFMVLGIGFKHKAGYHPLVWGFTISDRLSANGAFPRELVELVWTGNKQFEGQTLNLSSTEATGIYYREFSLGAARTIFAYRNWYIRLGARFNYYMGLSGVSNRRNQIMATTGTNAEFLELDYNIEYFYTGLDDFNLFRPKGHGFGGDFGLTVSYNDKLNFDIGINDVGSIRYSQDVQKIENEELFTFEGLDEGALRDPEAYFDSLATILSPVDTTGIDFTAKIGVKLSFMASWSFGESTKWRGPRELFFYYRQGFSERPGVTRNSKFALAFHRRVLRHMELGFSFSWGGFNNFGVGGLLGFRYKHFHISAYSDDFTGLIVPNEATGAGGGAMVKFLF